MEVKKTAEAEAYFLRPPDLVAFPCMSSSSRMFSAATTALSTNTRSKQERLEWLLLLGIYAQTVYDEQ